MPLTNAQKQAGYRARQQSALAQRTAALKQIVTLLADRDRPLTNQVRAIAEQGLAYPTNNR